MDFVELLELVESLDRGKDKWNFRYRATISRPDEWFNRTWNGNKGRVESFLQSKDGEMSPLANVASVGIEDAKTIKISPWDSSLIRAIEKGIVAPWCHPDQAIQPNRM